MFEALAAELVAEREQEIVMVVMVGAEQSGGLIDDGAMVRELVGRGGELGRLVGHDVQMDGCRAVRREVEAREIAAGEQGRVKQHVEWLGAEIGHVVGGKAGFERGSVLPAVGKVEGGGGVDVAKEVAGRIEHDGVPLQVEHVGSDDDAALALVGGREELEVGVEDGHTFGDLDVKGIHVDGIAMPGEPLAFGVELEAVEELDRTGRTVTAGDPLRVEQDKVARAGVERFVDGEDVTREVGRIDGEAQRSGIGNVTRTGDGGRHWKGLGCAGGECRGGGKGQQGGETVH